tara:strand:- start:102 stop:1091 length:990 start_codon:yes stop_codon:yes gene_type:complete
MAEEISESIQVNLKFLDFEQPIAELEAKIEDLRQLGNVSDVNMTEEIDQLANRSRELTQDIFSSLDSWQIARLARHPLRPYTMDYVEGLFDDIDELHGDRSFSDDPAIVAGIGRFYGCGVAFIGHQKGRTTKENLHRNFGMPRPEGYRKARRIMELAERFRLPIFTFIDTPGAYPGVGAEERGQSEAIASNLIAMSSLRTPILTTVIGEGGSGGALAIGVGDRVFMLKYATYAVISPEGCASILWKNTSKAGKAAEAMGITSSRLLKLEMIDGIIDEPLGGAHRDFALAIRMVGEQLAETLVELSKFDPDALLARRRARLQRFGTYIEK